MSKLINGEITSINEGIVADIELMIEHTLYGYSYAPSKMATEAAERVASYIATYKLDDPDHE